MKRKDKLSRLEAESSEMLRLLHEQVEEENASLVLRECRPYESAPHAGEEQDSTSDSQRNAVRLRRSLTSRRSFRAGRPMSPIWMAAALLVGFIIGFAMPRTAAPDRERTALLADSATYCRSIAAGDVNTALLVSLN